MATVSPRFDTLDKAEQDAITKGLDFVKGVAPWPSDWVATADYGGFRYNYKRNALGGSVWYGPYHIGQVKRYGRDEPTT